MSRELGIAHLTLLSLTPPEMVATAAAAGYDFVGLRVRAVTPTERAFAMGVGSPMLKETVLRLRDTGVVVRDVEFLPLAADTTADDWLPALESGAALGATCITVAGADPDRARLQDTLTRLSRDAAEYGMRAVLEPISYQPVSGVAEAADLARSTGSAVMLDPLHIQRGGSSLLEVRALTADLVPVLQLCDAPRSEPWSAEGRISALQHEARQERLIVGQGQLPLGELLAAAPAGTPVSIEIPHAAHQARMSPSAWAVRNLRAAQDLIARVDEDQQTEESAR